jgi:hypothetical protein
MSKKAGNPVSSKSKLAAMACLLWLVTLSAAAAEDDADAKFKKYCNALLRGTRSNADRTTKFHQAAQKAKDTKTRIALLDKAAEYGKISAPAWALQVAKKALDELDEIAPDRRDEWSVKRIDLYRRGFKRLGDKSRNKQVIGELLVDLLVKRARLLERRREWLKAAAAYDEAKFPAHTLDLPNKDTISRLHVRAKHLAKVQHAADELKRRLAKKPKDASLRMHLLRTLVVDLNSPKAAGEYLTDDVDERWRTYVPLAAKPSSELAPPACMELGDWYRHLAGQAGPLYSKRTMLVRAKAYYDRFLTHKGDDMKVKIRLAEVERAMEKLLPKHTTKTPPQ